MILPADLLPRYKHLRQVGLPLNNQFVKLLSREDIHEGARRLGILRKNTIVLDTEDQSSVLMDFCIHDVRRDGMTALDRYLAVSPPPADSDEMLLLKAKQQAWYSLFTVVGVERGVGVEFRDMLSNESMFILDVGLSQTGHRGSLLASRMMVAEGIGMTTGAGLPVSGFSRGDWERFVQSLAAMLKGENPRRLPPKVAGKLTATIVSACLKHGAAEHIHYRDPGEGIPNRPGAAPAARAGRNDPCPCGSVRKFKHCCGAPAGNRARPSVWRNRP
jgi:SEC-C motif